MICPKTLQEKISGHHFQRACNKLHELCTAPSWDDLHGAGDEPEHTLLLKAPFETAHRFGMHPGFLGALGGGAIAYDHHWTDEFIALLRGVIERQLRVVRIRKG